MTEPFIPHDQSARARTGAGYGPLGQETAHWGRAPIHIGAGNRPLGQGAYPHRGRIRAIGAGNCALGQVINLPQCGLACPNAARGAREGTAGGAAGAAAPGPRAPESARLGLRGHRADRTWPTGA
ncbi:hypothetical protein HMPREF9005_1616 [Actinomyces sp. oral taxon 178 str. F0338]|nr:hypothetical protein HMPREF9005_1616 [Actinomyces sp. oral taxon 178 str. F0338]